MRTRQREGIEILESGGAAVAGDATGISEWASLLPMCYPTKNTRAIGLSRSTFCLRILEPAIRLELMTC